MVRTFRARVRTALSGLPAGWKRACASRPARTPSPACVLTPRCICLPVCRLHCVRHDRVVDDGDGAQGHRLLTYTFSAASLQVENLFSQKLIVLDARTDDARNHQFFTRI